jgi:hypothetical protein
MSAILPTARIRSRRPHGLASGRHHSGPVDRAADDAAGGKYHVYIPSRLAYGEEKHNQMTGEVSIPANSDLVFDIELVDFKNGAEIERQRA